MQTRTWPYGTIKQVELLSRHERVRGPGGTICNVLVVGEVLGDGPKEAYILVGTTDQYQNGDTGDKGTITFCQGGPMGGHWKFERTQA